MEWDRTAHKICNNMNIDKDRVMERGIPTFRQVLGYSGENKKRGDSYASSSKSNAQVLIDDFTQQEQSVTLHRVTQRR